MIMSEVNYVYLGALPNFTIKEENFEKVKGKVLTCLIVLTSLKTWKSILEKWNGFSLQELIYLEYEW